jgi:hypothetical protein
MFSYNTVNKAEFSLLHVVQTGSGVHPVGTGGDFPGDKGAGT